MTLARRRGVAGLQRPQVRATARDIRRRRLIVAGAAAILVVAVIVALSSGGSRPALPLPGIGKPPRAGDPFAYLPSRQAAFIARATAGDAHVLFTKSPGGAVATAGRVAAFRPLIDTATAGTGIDPNLVEGIVLVESAGRTDVIAGTDPADAAGLTQILAQTGESLLGMHIDLARSRQLTRSIDRAAGAGNGGLVTKLQRQRAKIDDRFDPRKSLAATVRYLQFAEQRLCRPDLAVVSYLSSLQTATDSAAEVLQPPGQAPSFTDPTSLYGAYASRAVLPLPSNPASLGLAYDPGMASLAHQVGATRALYRGLRAPALDLLIELAARVRALAHGVGPLTVASTVVDGRYERALGISDPPATTGYSFTIARRYVSRAQAVAFQSMLDRLQALNLIAWERFSGVIEITVAADAGRVIVNGP